MYEKEAFVLYPILNALFVFTISFSIVSGLPSSTPNADIREAGL